MKFKTYYCQGDNYSQKYFEALIKHRLFFHEDGRRLDVDCIFNPQIIGYSDGRYDTMFKDKNEKLAENERKYFTKSTWIQKAKLKFQFGHFIIQKEPLGVIALLISVATLIITIKESM